MLSNEERNRIEFLRKEIAKLQAELQKLEDKEEWPCVGCGEYAPCVCGNLKY